MRHFVVALLLAVLVTAALSQEPQPLSINDPGQLVGKRVVIGRGVPVCELNTYNADISRTGKVATVLSVKPGQHYTMSQSVINRMPESQRSMLLDQRHSATVVFQFEDGKKLDTCSPMGPKALSEGSMGMGGLLLAPGETPVAAQPQAALTTPAVDKLSDDEVKAALAGIGKDHVVTINDAGFFAAQGAIGTLPHITLLMPEAFIAIRSQNAKKQFLAYEPTEDDMERALIVFAQGYIGKTVGEGCESITRVVLLSEERGGIVEEAYYGENGTEVWANAFGASNYCQWLRAKFSMAQVQRVRSAAKDGEFFIAIFAGSTKTKTYKIKRKHQEHLPWPAAGARP